VRLYDQAVALTCPYPVKRGASLLVHEAVLHICCLKEHLQQGNTAMVGSPVPARPPIGVLAVHVGPGPIDCIA